MFAVSHPTGIYRANVRILAERFVETFREGTGVVLAITDEDAEQGDAYEGYESYAWSDPAEWGDPE